MSNKNILIKTGRIYLKNEIHNIGNGVSIFSTSLQNKLQRILDYPVCGLSVRYRKLLMTNDEGGI
jgi:hypothetical protein